MSPARRPRPGVPPAAGPGAPPRTRSARPPSAPPRRAAAPSPAIGHPASGPGPAGAPGRHGQSRAGEDLRSYRLPRRPAASPAGRPATATMRRTHRGDAARRATAPGRAARRRPGPPLRREGPGCHTPRGRLGRNRLQTLASCRILACFRATGDWRAGEDRGESLSEAADHAARSHCPARPRARPEPLTSGPDGRPGKHAACCRSPDVGVHLENFGAGDLVGAPVPGVRRRPAAGLDDHGSGRILGRGPS